MRIEDIVNITDGELLNEGYIKDILAFSDEVKKVKREYLFISNNIDDIKEAIQKGAYAILFSKNLKIIDDEIAWIKVEDINEAFLKLLKYKLLDKTLYYTDEITLQIIASINRDKRLAIIDKVNFEYLNDDFIYVTSQEKVKNIAIEKKEIKKEISITPLHTTPFITEFSFNNQKYSLIFPVLYLENLEKALSFFENLELAYHLKDIKIDRFIPEFINSRYEKVAFGRTERVVIQGIKKDKYFIKELNYIFEELKYANVRFYDVTNIDSFYKDNFNFAVLIDYDVKLKEKEIKEVSLF